MDAHNSYPGGNNQVTLQTLADAPNAAMQLSVRGHVDAAAGRTIRRLTDDLRADAHIDIDLTEVTSIDAAGFNAIAIVIRIGDADHTATVTCAPGSIRHLLSITLLDQEAIVHESGPSQPPQTQGHLMATQYDFTHTEWDHVASTPYLVGLAIAKAEDSGFIGSIKESRALVAQLAATVEVQNPAHGLITTAVAADTKAHTGAFKAIAPITLAETAVAACTELAEMLARVATTEEAVAYKAWILSIATRVAEAATEAGVRISPKEATLLKRIANALG